VNGYPAVANRVSKLSISPGYISEIPLNLALKKWEAVEISEIVSTCAVRLTLSVTC
jgi:hypothetical protein